VIVSYWQHYDTYVSIFCYLQV